MDNIINFTLDALRRLDSAEMGLVHESSTDWSNDVAKAEKAAADRRKEFAKLIKEARGK